MVERPLDIDIFICLDHISRLIVLGHLDGRLDELLTKIRESEAYRNFGKRFDWSLAIKRHIVLAAPIVETISLVNGFKRHIVMAALFPTRQASADSFLIRCSLRNLSRVTECDQSNRFNNGRSHYNMAFYFKWPIKSFTEISVSLAFASIFLLTIRPDVRLGVQGR